jgi:hypothetical protein
MLTKVTAESVPIGAKFSYVDGDRWPEVRSWKVDVIRDLWSVEPNRVQVIRDPRLGECSMVLLRKDLFERLKNIASDVESGEAAVRHNVDLLLNTIELVDDESLLGDPTNDRVRKAIKVLRGVAAKLRTEVYVMKSKASHFPSPLSDEEKSIDLDNDEM